MHKLLGDKRVRFLVVGLLNTVTDIAIYWLLTQSGMALVVANFISTSAGMTVSYTLNRGFTFRAQSGNTRRQIILFLIVTLFGLWVIQPIVIVASRGFFDGPHWWGLENVLPKLIATCASLAWNYLLYNKVVFTITKN